MLTLGFVMAYYVNSTVNNLKFDALIINETGTLRGSIQRATKLALLNSPELAGQLITDINRQFDHFVSSDDCNNHEGAEDIVFRGVIELRREWNSLENLLNEFLVVPSDEIIMGIILESEHCWETADSIVLNAQFATEGKVGEFELFYKILVINAITAVLIILYIVLYVRKKLEFEAFHDPLTGLLNRRSYGEVIQSEVARSVRYNSRLSLIIFDIDNFKLVNDNHGHGVGDRLFIDLAREVSQSVRESDFVFRVGGDEFAILCPETSADGAFKLAEKIRKKTEGYSFGTGETETISLGVAEFHKGLTKKQLDKLADQALYKAKNNGRNRTEIST